MRDLDRLIQLLQTKGVMPSADIQAGLTINQPKVSRLIKQAGSEIIHIGKARTSRYALASPTFGHEDNIPMYSLDETGQAQHICNLHALANGQYYIETEENTPWLKGEAGNGIFPGLPYFINDLRPRGFLGRKIAIYYAQRYGFPEMLDYWNENQLGTYFLQDGYNLPGNLILGEQALKAAQHNTIDIVSDRETTYPDKASSILMQWQAGSSTAGEQQKFIACTADRGHVIVKFSPAGNSAEARRWQDLLVCEYHALNTMKQAGKIAADTTIYKFDDRIFLESKRFDRIGQTGRIPMISLAAIDYEFTGHGGSWTQITQHLYKKKLITEQDYRSCIWNDMYGQWIGNSDRHPGNISMTTTDSGFELLPAYDMLPMIYAPERGEIINRNLNTPIKPMKQYLNLWKESAETACLFWHNVGEDEIISDDFRQIAENNLRPVKQKMQ